MSRIGKKVIDVPGSVTVTTTDDKITVKGPKGELSTHRHPDVEVNLEDGKLTLNCTSHERLARSMWGTTRALIANMVQGVTQGYEKKLEISGVGYQAAPMGKYIELTLGFNKPVNFDIPSTVTIDVPSPTSIVITGCDKQQVGEFAASIRKIRPPEPYKGKGIKYDDEVIKRKAGKAFGSA